MRHFIGIDLGGTNVRVAKVNEEGEIVQDVIAPSYGLEGPEKIESNMLDLIKQFDLSDVAGIGMAIPGPVDGVTNLITQATNIPGCAGYPFAQNMEKATGVKVYLDNDANAAGLAEAVLGAGKGHKIVYYLTHSTGIGAGFIIDGKIVQGHKGYCGEVANIIVDPSAKQFEAYAGLNKGGLESLCSGRALGLFGNELIGEEVQGGSDVFKLAKEGNEIALDLIDKMCKYMAMAISDIYSIVAPDCIVIGGGVTHSSDMYFDKMIEYLNGMIADSMKDVPVKKAELKEPGVLGAAMIARSRCE